MDTASELIMVIILREATSFFLKKALSGFLRGIRQQQNPFSCSYSSVVSRFTVEASRSAFTQDFLGLKRVFIFAFFTALST